MVVVKFSQTMIPKYVLSDSESRKSPQRVLADFSGEEEFTSVEGNARTEFEKFTPLHNKTGLLNGEVFPSVLLAVEPDDPEDLCAKQLDFTWEAVKFSEIELVF